MKTTGRLSAGVSPLDVFQVMFVYLKLTGEIDASWWIVFLPYIGLLVLLFVVELVERKGN